MPSCLLATGVRNFALAGSPAYDALLNFSIQNLRFSLPAGVPRPAAVVLPGSRRELQSALLCVRSGGQSYEGLSCTVVDDDDARVRFVVIDLMRMNRVRVDAASANVWVESGATLGKLYYAVASSSSSRQNGSSSLAFPAASCSTVGAGSCTSGSTSAQLCPTGSTSPSSSPQDGNVTVSFTGLFLGSKELTMSVLSESFPELGLGKPELSEMSWVESAARLSGLSSVKEPTNRDSKTKHYAKSKSDYVRLPILRDAVAAILWYLAGGPAGYVILDPYGGAMAPVGSADTPFPHRAGNLYSVQYGVTWEAGDGDGEARMAWLRTLYAYMAPHVSKNPRSPRMSTSWTSTSSPMLSPGTGRRRRRRR